MLQGHARSPSVGRGSTGPAPCPAFMHGSPHTHALSPVLPRSRGRAGGGLRPPACVRPGPGVDALAVALMANMHSTTRLSRQRAQPWGCPGGKA